MANVRGKAYALTAFTRMHPAKTYGLRLVFFLIRLSMLPIPASQVGTIGAHQAGTARPDAAVVHPLCAVGDHQRGQFPRVDPSQKEEALNYDYLLFESNFNGDWEKYIDAFSQVVPGGMDNIWRWSVKYPQSRPITPFLNYIRNCQYDTDYYYSAYPGASTNDVRGALLLKEKLDAFARTSAGLTPEEFARAYQIFTVEIQNCLSTTGRQSFVASPAAQRAVAAHA